MRIVIPRRTENRNSKGHSEKSPEMRLKKENPNSKTKEAA